jgi:hypothetical protein
MKGGRRVLLLTTQAHPQMLEYRHPNLGRLLTPRHFPRLHDTLAEGFPVAADNDCFHGYRPESIARLFGAIVEWPSVIARVHKAWPTLAARHYLSTSGGLVPDLAMTRPPPLATLPPNLLWVAVPDVLRCACGAEEYHRKDDRGPGCAPRGDADATLERFRDWHLWLCHLPLAFVLQDGSERPGRVPWDAPGLAGVFVGGSDEWKLGPDAARLVAEARARGLYAHMGRVNSEKRIRYAISIGCTSVDGTSWVTWRDAHLRRGLNYCARTRPQPVHWQTRLGV